jgi:hypothetical protein
LSEVLKYVITLLKNQWIKLPTSPLYQPPIGLLTDKELNNYVDNGLRITPITGRIDNKYELTNSEQTRILGLLKAPSVNLKTPAKNFKKVVVTSPYPTDYQNKNNKRGDKKKGGSTKKKKKRRSKRRKTRKY